MAQITINNVFEKIRSICKECAFLEQPQRFTAENDEIIEAYLKTLESIRLELGRLRRLEEEYLKLQRVLQKEETELRRRVGVENELKLYIESLKQENYEMEREKLELLDNTKIHIKQLKKVNENLFAELTAEVNKHRAANLEATERSNQKIIKQKMADISRSLNKNKTKRQKSIKQIVKTQFIEREKLNTETKKQRKIHHYKLHSSIMSEQQGDNHRLQQNLRTFQEYTNGNTGRNIKNTPQQLAKGNNHFVSNQTLSKIANKRSERDKIAKSPYRLEKRDHFNKSKAQNLSRHLSRQRKHNKSVYSVLSAEQIQNQKDIF